MARRLIFTHETPNGTFVVHYDNELGEYRVAKRIGLSTSTDEASAYYTTARVDAFNTLAHMGKQASV